MRRQLMRSAACCGVALAGHLGAQERIALDFRGSVAMPIEKLAGAELGTGLGFGGVFAVRVQPHLYVYTGWDWLHFNPESSFAGSDVDFEETGYTFGLRFDHPFRDGSPMTFRLEAGGTFKHIEFESNDGDAVVDSDHSLGFELGAGFTVPLAGSWRLAPMVRFRSLKPEFDFDDIVTRGNMRYVGFELGIAKRF